MRKAVLYVVMAFVLCLFGGIVYMMMQGGTSTSTAAMRQVTDSTGETMEIPEHPQRVVFLNASNMDMYVAAGGASLTCRKSALFIRRISKKYCP